jgi:hypothetical protein
MVRDCELSRKSGIARNDGLKGFNAFVSFGYNPVFNLDRLALFDFRYQPANTHSFQHINHPRLPKLPDFTAKVFSAQRMDNSCSLPEDDKFHILFYPARHALII